MQPTIIFIVDSSFSLENIIANTMPSQVTRVQRDVLNILALSDKQPRKTSISFGMIHEPNILLSEASSSKCVVFVLDK